MDIKLLQSMVYELKNLNDKISIYLKTNDYVYANVFKTWVDRFNKCIVAYNGKATVPIMPYNIDSWDYSTTQKTIRQSGIDSFVNTILQLIDKFESEVDEVRRKEQEKEIPFYQLRKYRYNV